MSGDRPHLDGLTQIGWTRRHLMRVYQSIRSCGESDWPLAKIIGFANRETP